MIRSISRDLAYEFLKDRLGLSYTADFRGALYVEDKYHCRVMEFGHVGVALGYSGFTGKTCQMSVVVQHKEVLTKQVIREAFEFPFLVCGVEVVFATVDSTNKASLEICERVGFERVRTFANAGLEGDMVLFAMTRNQCRWIRHGKERTPGPGLSRGG